MGSSSPAAHSLNEAAEDGDSSTPRGSGIRPPLTRTQSARPSQTSLGLPERRNSRTNEESSMAEQPQEQTRQDDLPNSENDATPVQETRDADKTEDDRLAALRDAMNARLLMQQRARRSYGSPKSDGVSPRVAAIQEEEKSASSQSINTVLARTSSADSNESSRTIRAEKASSAKASAPFRTPSYPFPYVPDRPNAWPSHLHQPFTTLSPTALGGPTSRRESGPAGDGTPDDVTAFLPADDRHPGQEDPAFPTPNLYDMVLQLNAEPGLEQWWAAVTNLMHDNFRADRATVVVPRDSSEIENVPWGQKATFSMNGPEEFVSHRRVLEQIWDAGAPPQPASKMDSMEDIKRQKLHSGRFRPRLEARHSYAGHGRDESESSHPTRPPAPQRTATHAAGVTPVPLTQRLAPRRFDSSSTQQHSSLGNPEFSNVEGGGVDVGPYAEVFQILRGLDHEVRPLIDRSGVNRVLERGRVVMVTRDYASGSSNVDDSDNKQVPEEFSAGITPNVTPRPSVVGRGDTGSSNTLPTTKDYEEYEQIPSDSWSQSPAPSPAIQANEDEDPFFASNEQHVEDSFNPTASPKDYSQLGQVEAIGVDHASTVIHIPLVHPIISQTMPLMRPSSTSSGKPGGQSRSNTLDTERKAPIAILSILTSTVPYPRNLASALSMLGPHLATSLATSQQISATRAKVVTIRQRKSDSGQAVSTAPMTIVSTSLEDIIDVEVDRYPGPPSTGFTSPSDYSGQSPYSSTSSIVGTPGWDPATHGLASKGGTVTPAMTGSELVDSYFEAKKRSVRRSGSTAGTHAQNTPGRAMKTVFSGSERKRGSRKPSSPPIQGSSLSQGDRVTSDPPSKDAQSLVPDKSPSQSPQLAASNNQAPQHATTPGVDVTSNKKHSQLHSYGADVQSSFGVLPSSASADLPTTGFVGHARHSSHPEGMPPPSERLLRTIIDSVPVQIFTAEPDTGKLSWVNSKFMVYRAQEANEVLDDPWQAIHPDDRSEFMTTWHRSLRTAQQLQQKVRLKRFDGSYRWFYVRAAPLKDKKQKIVHWIGTMMDFHEQNLAQETAAKQQETAASEAKYRALANSSPQIVFAVHKSKGIVFCNTQWVQFSGQSEAQARGVGFMDHVHPDDLVKCKLPTFEEGSSIPKGVPTSVPPELNRRTSGSAGSSSGSSETERVASSPASSPLTTQMPQKKLSELAGTGILKVSRDADGRPSYSTEVRLRSKEGEYKWHLVRVLLAEPLLQKDEDEETWYGTCTDISDHKALERDLKQTMDEKSRFLSNMSHEIRTPLNGITGMVNFLIDSSLTTEQLEHVNIIRASTEGLRGLINDILDLSKAEAGMIQLNMDWLYVRSLIEEVNDLTSAMAIDKGIELNYVVDEMVPNQIKGDRFRVRQILLNIVGNAIKFTKRGEVFIHCSTYAAEEFELAENEQYIKFEVIDTGRGFTNEEAEYLFKRFSQIDGSSTRQHGGTGLGLVISKQLAQLHGGDMGAKGEPGKGATFTCLIKATLPSPADEPPTPLLTPGGVTIPILPLSPKHLYPPGTTQTTPGSTETHVKPFSKLGLEQTQSPSQYVTSPDVGRESPSVSSASSDPSLKSTTRSSSLRSEGSSASSYVGDVAGTGPPMKLALPTGSKSSRPGAKGSSSSSSLPPNIMKASGAGPTSPGGGITPPMFSILVVCPLRYSREATVQHIDKTLPKNVPHQITAREHLSECQKMMSGDDPVIFTHIVVVLHDVAEIAALMDQVLQSAAHQSTSVVIITDLAQKRRIMEHAPKYDYEQLRKDRRLLFVFKPLKPSRFAAIFDPQKEREMSLDRNKDSAQQVALTQKQVFEEVTRRLGNRDKRVLLVEDNRTNQLVVMKFLSKVSIAVDTAVDGVECTEKVFSQPAGHYSIILCDLHMPNKDGYQTCREIRKWERDHHIPHLPIVALSANVLGDVHEKCVASGFNSYLTKPVDFKELGTVLVTFMDPNDPSKPHEFMKTKAKRRKASAAGV